MEPVPYPRDMVGYGRTPPDPQWPGGALLALNIVARTLGARSASK